MPNALIAQALASPHTRLPVYRDEPENIIGVIHAKDLLREVERLLRTPESGGTAALEIWIDEADLAAGRFDRAVALVV